MAGKKSRGFITYRSYMFKENDPLIDLITSARSSLKLSYKELSEKSDVTVSTIRNWEHGKVKRPFACTALAAVFGMGYSGITMKNGKPVLMQRNGNK